MGSVTASILGPLPSLLLAGVPLGEPAATAQHSRQRSLPRPSPQDEKIRARTVSTATSLGRRPALSRAARGARRPRVLPLLCLPGLSVVSNLSSSPGRCLISFAARSIHAPRRCPARRAPSLPCAPRHHRRVVQRTHCPPSVPPSPVPDNSLLLRFSDRPGAGAPPPRSRRRAPSTRRGWRQCSRGSPRPRTRSG